MKKVSVYVLILGVLIGIISGAIFASESTTVAQSGTTSTLSGTTDNHATLGLDATDRPDGAGPGGGWFRWLWR
jgi:hypothetical protein